MTQTVGIVGAGLMGQVLAYTLAQQGWRVSLIERDGPTVPHSCAYMGAGMLSPVSELETAETLIARLGFDALPLWRELVNSCELPIYFQEQGTLIVSHPLDFPDLAQFRKALQHKLKGFDANDLPEQTTTSIQWQLSSVELTRLEPQLGNRFQSGIYIPDEGQIDNRQLLQALQQQLHTLGVTYLFETTVNDVQSHQIHTPDHIFSFDWVIDCRGLGGKPDWNNLRGVRGEIIRVHAPDVSLTRPVRLMHPRYPLYIAPRENHHYVIGATSLESEDIRPMSLQSAMELLSAAFSIHPGFAEASILEMGVNCRPALPDHLPRIQLEPGLIRVNGLYRHGFLIAPQLAKLIGDSLAHRPISTDYQTIFEDKCPYPSGKEKPIRHAIAN